MSLPRPIARRRIPLPQGAGEAYAAELLGRTKSSKQDLADFEDAFAQYVGCRWAVGAASARQGLWMALRALDLKPREEVLCPAYTFHAMPEVIVQAGAVPRFVEADPETWQMDPARLEQARTPRTRAILATHLFGHPCDMTQILSFAKRHGLRVIEDCAHALGAALGNRRAGSLGDVGIFSFGPGKGLPCLGGGMLTTDDEALGRRLRQLSAAGSAASLPQLTTQLIKTAGIAWATGPGFSYVGLPIIRMFPGAADALTGEVPGRKLRASTRLAGLQARLGLKQLPQLEAWNLKRRENSEFLHQALALTPGVRQQKAVPESLPSYLYFRVLVKKRELLRRELLKFGLDTKSDDMSNCGGAAYPIAQGLAAQSLELPNGLELSCADLERIAQWVRQALASI